MKDFGKMINNKVLVNKDGLMVLIMKVIFMMVKDKDKVKLYIQMVHIIKDNLQII